MNFWLILMSGCIIVSSCASSNRNKTQLAVVPSQIQFMSLSFSFHHIDGNSNVFGRIVERGLRDTFNLLLPKAVDIYFSGARLSTPGKSTCLDYSMHRGNWREPKWKEYSTYVCLKPPPDRFAIHLSVMFEDYDGSTLGMSNPPSNSWIGIYITAFKDSTIVFNKYIYDAINITKRQEKMMLLSRNYNPYFPKSQVIRVMDRVFTYLQKKLK